MVIDYIWQNANPELRSHLRAANEARAAAYYAAWRTLTAPLRVLIQTLVQTLVQTLGQAKRAGETFRALNHLSDRQLQDIGISRSEIGSVANAIAAKPLETGMTIADLRQTEIVASASSGVTATSRSRVDLRRSAPARRAAPAAHHREAA